MTFVTRDQIDEVMPSAAGDKVRMHIFDLVARDPTAI